MRSKNIRIAAAIGVGAVAFGVRTFTLPGRPAPAMKIARLAFELPAPPPAPAPPEAQPAPAPVVEAARPAPEKRVACAPGLHFEPGRLCVRDETVVAKGDDLGAILASVNLDESMKAVEDVSKHCDYGAPGAACALLDAMSGAPFETADPAQPSKAVVFAYTAKLEAQAAADPELRKDAHAWGSAWRNLALFPERIEAWEKAHPEAMKPSSSRAKR
jgi:hypothetical protein